VLAHAEKTADAEDDVLDLAGLVDDQFLMSPIFSLASLQTLTPSAWKVSSVGRGEGDYYWPSRQISL
jgi:hypothetical protein